jgi:hypothetical protein
MDPAGESAIPGPWLDRGFAGLFLVFPLRLKHFCNRVLKMEHYRSAPCDYESVSGRVLCLDIHASYRCRHSGACCTAGWAIPIEGPAFETLRVHFGRERDLFRTGGPLPEGAVAILGIDRNGACVFFDEENKRLCRVHRDVGQEYLPAACRQFPRIALHDPRGTLISLSHYCPTAASLIAGVASRDRWAIVPAPSSLAIDGVEGLDARDALPPLLAPGLLMDIEGYDAWERQAIELFADGTYSAAACIGAIDDASQRLQRWRPGDETLADAVAREFAIASAREDDEDLEADVARLAAADASVPQELRRPPPETGIEHAWAQVAPWWPSVDPAVRAYLAARLFGNWIAYYGQGVHAIVEYLRVCLSVLKLEAARLQRATTTGSTSSAVSALSPWQTVTEAIRSADLLLVHLSDPKELARHLEKPLRRD